MQKIVTSRTNQEDRSMNSKENKWSRAEEFKLREMIGAGKTKKQVAEELNRSVQAVHLFCYRYKVPVRPVLKTSNVRSMLTVKFGNPDYFAPTKDFFAKTKISSHRWTELSFGYCQATTEECVAIARELKFSSEELLKIMEARQLSLFD